MKWVNPPENEMISIMLAVIKNTMREYSSLNPFFIKDPPVTAKERISKFIRIKLYICKATNKR